MRAYILELRRKEKDFIKELESHGHKIQSEFRGYRVGARSNKNKPTTEIVSKKSLKFEWKVKKGLLQFWDGSEFVVGEDPGLYVLPGEIHYWNGEEWWIPEEVGMYDLNGEEHFWNGTCWE